MSAASDDLTTDELREKIEDLRDMIGDNEHPDDYVSEREDLASMEAELTRREAAGILPNCTCGKCDPACRSAFYRPCCGACCEAEASA